MIQGSCLCGGMRFELDEEHIYFINNCHCSWCRKASGAAYGTFVHLPGAHFRWIAGQDLRSSFESTPGNHRGFCKVCGSRAPGFVYGDEKHVVVPAGLLDGDPLARPRVNIYTGSKAPWHQISEPIPAFETVPPQEFWLSLWEERHGPAGS